MPRRPRPYSLWVLGTREAHKRLLAEAFDRAHDFKSAGEYLGVHRAFVMRRARELGVVPPWEGQ